MNGYGDQPEFKFDKIQFEPFKKYIIPIAFIIVISVIGKLTDKEDGLNIVVNGNVRELPFLKVDEMTRAT